MLHTTIDKMPASVACHLKCVHTVLVKLGKISRLVSTFFALLKSEINVKNKLLA